MRRCAPAVAVVALAATRGPALACPDPAAQALAAQLDREAHAARTWDIAWGIGLGAAAAGYATLAATDWEFGATVDRGTRDLFWAGAAKAGIAALSHLVVPLRIPRVRGACPTAADAEAARAEAARHERTAFWLGLAGGAVLLGGGLLFVGLRDHAWGAGAVDAGLSSAVGLAHMLTMPHHARRWQLAGVASPQFTGMVMAGQF